MNFLFNEWVDLYKNDPAEFERKRRTIIELEILKAPIKNRNKLRLIQMECDAYRLQLSALDATIAISGLMLEKIELLKTQLEELKQHIEKLQ